MSDARGGAAEAWHQFLATAVSIGAEPRDVFAWAYMAGWAHDRWPAIVDIVPPPELSTEITEYAMMMSGGGMHVRCDDPEIERIYPLAKWIPRQQQLGGKVYRRRVIVTEDWEDVGPSATAALPKRKD